MLYFIRKQPHKVAAVVVWVLALGATYNFLSEYALPASYALLGAVLLQGLLTYLQHFVWARGTNGFETLGYVALVVDGFINFGGAYPITSRLHLTSSYQGISESLGLQSPMVPGLLSFLLAATLSILLCAAPERLWALQPGRA